MNEAISIKEKYLDKYNYDRKHSDAISSAISAAVQHNKLYSSNLPLKSKKNIRDYWGVCLEEIGWEFKKDVSIVKYEEIISALQRQMNREFGIDFNNGSEHGSMFRISHAQKSISVYIKILWCMGEISEPTICPVDRIILSQTEAKKLKDVSWGYVNTIEEHRKKFKYIQKAATLSDMSVAMWELFIFSN